MPVLIWDSSSDYLSLTDEANEYVFENGRRYHGYKPGRKCSHVRCCGVILSILQDICFQMMRYEIFPLATLCL